MAKAEGKYFEFDGEDQINTDFLETFSFESPDQYIMTETDDFFFENIPGAPCKSLATAKPKMIV